MAILWPSPITLSEKTKQLKTSQIALGVGSYFVLSIDNSGIWVHWVVSGQVRTIIICCQCHVVQDACALHKLTGLFNIMEADPIKIFKFSAGGSSQFNFEVCT